MFTVLSKEKVGNKVTYTLKSEETGELADGISKDTLISYIQASQVTNARIQNYKGQLIIRLKDNVESSSKSSEKSGSTNKQRRSTKSRVVLGIDLFRRVMKDFGVDKEEEALSWAFDKYELDKEYTSKDKLEIAKVSYQMASDVKRAIDKENNNKLLNYKITFEAETAVLAERGYL